MNIEEWASDKVKGKGMVIKMNCPKCNGLMMYEKFMDMAETSSYYFYGWRCVFCGNVIDSTIMANRVSKDRQTVVKRRRLKRAG